MRVIDDQQQEGRDGKGVSRSTIAFGSVYHWRAIPREHAFTYSVFTFQLDIDELADLRISPRLFGVDRQAIFSLRTADYLRGPGTLREKVEQVFRERGIAESPKRILLITSPRYFGYVFNPVSFFVCFDSQDHVMGLITQVNNTFGETHVYPLMCHPATMPITWRFPKEFFVSPFFEVEGGYVVTLKKAGVDLAIQVDLQKEERIIFSAVLKGVSKPLSRSRVLQTLLRYPLTPFLTMPRIHKQALTLFFKVRACPFHKPQPSHPYTIRSQQSIIHRARLKLLAFLKGCRT